MFWFSLEQVLGVVAILQRDEPRVLLLAVAGAHAVLAFVGGVVQVHAVGHMGLQVGREPARPRDVRLRRLGVGLHPHRERVVAPRHVAAAERGLVVADAADRAAHRLHQQLHHRAGAAAAAATILSIASSPSSGRNSAFM